MARTALDLLDQDQRRTQAAAGLRAIEKRSTQSEAYKLTDPRLGTLLSGYAGSNSGVPVTEQTGIKVATVFACTRILAESVAALPLKLYRKTARGREEATNHPLFELLKTEPWAGRQTSMEWREMLQGHLCLRGNAYALIERDSFYTPTNLRPLHPSNIIPWENGGELFYHVQDRGRDYTASDILHLRGLSDDGTMGISPVRTLIDPIGQTLAARKHLGGNYANGNKFPGILKTPTMLKPEQLKLLRDEWDKQRSGDNAGKPPIMFGGLDWQSVGMNHEEAQVLEGMHFDVKDIASAYRVPMVMLAHGDKAATYASVEQFMLSFVKQTLMPWLVRWEQRLNLQLLTQRERRRGYYFSFNLRALLRGDAKTEAEVYQILRQIRAIKINEIRSWLEMDDLPDAIGDNVREGFNGQGGGHDGDQTLTPTPDMEETTDE